MATVAPVKETFEITHLTPLNKKRTKTQTMNQLPQYCKSGLHHDTDEPNEKRPMLGSHSRAKDEGCDSTYDKLVTTAMHIENANENDFQMIENLLASDHEVSPGIKVTELLNYVFSMRRKAFLAQLRSHTKDNKESTTEWDQDMPKENAADCVDGFPTSSSMNHFKNVVSEKACLFAQAKLIELKNWFEITNKDSDDDIDGHFDELKRIGISGKLVMNTVGESGQLVPVGSYYLHELAKCCTTDALVPEYVEVTVTWDSQTGCVVFPKDFCGIIPKVIATHEYLRYYDCQMASHNLAVVSLLSEQEIQTFNYRPGYLDEYVKPQEKDGGASLERHPFAHLDCPFSKTSGVLVLGKFTDSSETQLHLTGFYVPRGETVYIPGNVIHTNNYFCGKWKTMLAGGVDVDLVHLVKGDKNREHFSFTFPDLNIN